MSSSLLLIKSLYTFSLIYFEFPLLQAAPLKFLSCLALFNYTVSFLWSRKNHSVKLFRSIIAAAGISWFLVVVAGAGPFKLNTLVFSVFLASSAFNFITLPVILYQPDIKQQLFELKLLSLAKSPASFTPLCSLLGSLIGALLTGLIVILDWNEEWQKFPIPNFIGCLFGELCGILASYILQLI